MVMDRVKCILGTGRATGILFALFIMVSLAQASPQGAHNNNASGRSQKGSPVYRSVNAGNNGNGNPGPARNPPTPPPTPSAAPPVTYRPFAELADDREYFTGDSEGITKPDEKNQAGGADVLPDGENGALKCPQDPSPRQPPAAFYLDQEPLDVQLAKALEITCSVFRKLAQEEAKGRDFWNSDTITDSCGVVYAIRDRNRQTLFAHTMTMLPLRFKGSLMLRQELL